MVDCHDIILGTWHIFCGIFVLFSGLYGGKSNVNRPKSFAPRTRTMDKNNHLNLKNLKRPFSHF